MIRVVVQNEPIDLAAELRIMEDRGAGGIATFTGLVRADDGVGTLELEHYPGTTEKMLTEIATQAVRQWSLLGATIIHRIGTMNVGERIVFVAADSTHRETALLACSFLIDRLKTDAPFWKREIRGRNARWVDARDSDTVTAARWTT